MRVLLIGFDGTSEEREVQHNGIFVGGRYQLKSEHQQGDEPLIIIVVDPKEDCWDGDGEAPKARRVFTLHLDESYREETGNLPVYHEKPCVVI